MSAGASKEHLPSVENECIPPEGNVNLIFVTVISLPTDEIYYIMTMVTDNRRLVTGGMPDFAVGTNQIVDAE